jgi:hypothetical protein
VRGGKQTQVCSRTVHSSDVVSNTENRMKFTLLLILAFIILSCNSEPKTQSLNRRTSIEVITDFSETIEIRRFQILNGNIKDSIVEYLKIDGEEYANQIWLVNNKDTIGGNYFKSWIKDSIKLGEVARLRYELIKPTISHESDIHILIPMNDNELENDYSNLFDIKLDTLPSLKNDGISHPEISEFNLPLNHIVEFGLKYGKPGKKRVRGVIIERGKKDNRGYERRLFFNNSFYVKE